MGYSQMDGGNFKENPSTKMDDNWGYLHDLYRKPSSVVSYVVCSWIDESNSGLMNPSYCTTGHSGAQQLIEASQAMAGLEKCCDKYG